MYIPYPKWLYHDHLPDLIVKDRQEHLVKQAEGYHQHDGTLIGDVKPIVPVKEQAVEEKEEEVPEIVFPEYKPKKAGRPKKG